MQMNLRPSFWWMLSLAMLFSMHRTLLAGDKPNFVVILADDLGFSDLGCYGGEIETPHLDRLAAKGLRFTQFYNTARCWPTRGALLTGYYAQQIGRDALPEKSGGSQGKRPKWARLLPELLKSQGYRSYISGKWHVDGKPTESGFDRSYVVENHNNYFYARQHFLDDRPLPNIPKDAGKYITGLIADRAIEFLSEHFQNNSQQPFFQFVAFTSPHFPIQAPADGIAKYNGRYSRGWDRVREDRWKRIQQQQIVFGQLSKPEIDLGPPYHFPDALEKLGDGEVNRPVPWEKLTDAQQQFQSTKMQIHAAMVDRMDQEIGRIIHCLEENGKLDDTLILFLSDNGASAEIMVRGDGHDPHSPLGSAESYLCLGPGWSTTANTPFRKHKTWVHEGGIATPMIAHWPKRIASHGQLCQQVGHVIDIAPTLLKLAGGQWPESWQDAQSKERFAVPPSPGEDFVDPLVTGKASPANQEQRVLWWLHEGNRALRRGDWKIVATKDQPWELYNLAKDRTEVADLADELSGKVAELEAIWQQNVQAFTQLRSQ